MGCAQFPSRAPTPDPTRQPPHHAPLSALTVDWAPPVRLGLPRVVAPEADFLVAEAAVELAVAVGGTRALPWGQGYKLVVLVTLPSALISVCASTR